MTRLAYTAIVDKNGFTLGIAEENVRGYSPDPNGERWGLYKTLDEARAAADELNTRMGLTPEEAMLIVLSSMREQNIANAKRRRS